MRNIKNVFQKQGDVKPISIPIIYYTKDHKKLNRIKGQYDNYNLKIINNASKFKILFENYLHLHFISIDDLEYYNGMVISELIPIPMPNEIVINNKDLTVAINGDDFVLENYIISDYLYINHIFSKLDYINPNGKIDVIWSHQSDSYINYLIDSRLREQFNSESLYDREQFNSLDSFINFFLDIGKITYVSRREDYKAADTFYTNLKDISLIDLHSDICSIVSYSLISNQLNLYKTESLWAEYILNNDSYGHTVIDESHTILYANKKKRLRYKNNILGKKCHELFCKSIQQACDDCTFSELFKNPSTHPRRNEKRVTDKAGNMYWISENNSVSYVRNESYKLGIISTRDINFQHEINNLAIEIQELENDEEIFTEIDNTFITKLGFKRIRLYNNFSLSNTPPHLCLIHYSGHDDDDQIYRGIELTPELLTDSDLTTYNKSILDQFIEINDDYKSLRLYNKTDFVKEEGRDLVNQLELDDKWLFLPLWAGDQLIGAIGLDIHKNHEKLELINENEKFQLTTGCKFLASSLVKTINANISQLYLNTTEQIQSINEQKNIENKICEMIESNGENLHIFMLVSSPSSNDHYLIYRKNNDHTLPFSKNKVNINFAKLLSTPKSLYKPVIRKEKVPALVPFIIESSIGMINSFARYPLKKNNDIFGFLYILKTGKDIKPIYTQEYFLFNLVADQIANLLYSYHARRNIHKMISFISDSLNEISDIESLIEEFMKRFREIIPQTRAAIYLLKDDYLELRGSIRMTKNRLYNGKYIYRLPPTQLSPTETLEYTRKEKLGFTSLFASFFDDEILYYKTSDDLDKELSKYFDSDYLMNTHHNNYFAQSTLGGSKSHIFAKIVYKKECIGILKFENSEEGVFDDEFRNSVKIICKLLGKNIGLLRDLEVEENKNATLIHELKGPIQSAYQVFRPSVLPANLSIQLETDQQIPEGQRVSVKKRLLFKYLRLLKNNLTMSTFFIQNQQFGFQDVNQNAKKYDLLKIVSEVCHVLKYASSANKPGLNLDWSGVRKQHVQGVKEELLRGFYNVIDNAIKYSHEINGKYKKIIVTGEILPADRNLFQINVVNYGEVVKINEISDLFNKGERGSNTEIIDTQGLGLGLFFCKKIFKRHHAAISMSVDPIMKSTTISIVFDLKKNSKLGEK